MISLQGDKRIVCQHFASWEIPDDNYFLDFYHPEYCIGQTILHRMKVTGGEILHPVKVIGIFWTGVDWEYEVLLPPDHPEWVEEDNQFKYLELYYIEPL